VMSRMFTDPLTLVRSAIVSMLDLTRAILIPVLSEPKRYKNPP
jgi:hypothetical protein